MRAISDRHEVFVISCVGVKESCARRLGATAAPAVAVAYHLAMRIAASHAAQTPNPTPAQAWIDKAAWLVRPGSGVLALEPVDEATVRVFVADPFVVDPADQVEADHLLADSARSVLEEALHGVRLLPTTRLGYEGRDRDLTPAQVTFNTALPGVQRYDLVPTDLNGDGAVAPGELAHRIEVDTAEDAARIDWLLKDRLDGTIQPGPVHVVVPQDAWTVAPIAGARA
ncbi:MAG: hypothetical protein JWM86_439 [Thermoleophilia bacterium]|nr:hypothetical protein [Thermoleophilia bacterium]